MPCFCPFWVPSNQLVFLLAVDVGIVTITAFADLIARAGAMMAATLPLPTSYG